MKSLSRTHFVFIFLVIIAMGQAIWWGHLLMQQQSVIAVHVGTEEALSEAYRFQTMIWSEGLFFFGMWCFALWTAFKASKDERVLERAQADFVGAVTHELKTPITNIRLCLDSLERVGPDLEKQKIYMNRAQLSLARLESEIETVLVLAQSTSSDLSVDHVQLTHLVEQALAPALDFQKTGLNIINKVDPDIFLKTSSESVRMMLQMLLNNAVKYSVARKTEEKNPDAFLPAVHVESYIEHGLLRIQVKDNGIGLRQEELKAIFKPFWRSEEVKRLSLPGTGVGLTLAKRFADRLKIGLDIQSPGMMSGTIATLTFPPHQFEKRSAK
ncbi:MAG: HAMP domain-containing histidine kinase [Bdellovibrionales bacterium]|nr:HAMP domain-containing histidine kinase [Bdellovibrionales bacterium]